MIWLIVKQVHYGRSSQTYDADADVVSCSQSLQGHANAKQKLKSLFCLSGQ